MKALLLLFSLMLTIPALSSENVKSVDRPSQAQEVATHLNQSIEQSDSPVVKKPKKKRRGGKMALILLGILAFWLGLGMLLTALLIFALGYAAAVFFIIAAVMMVGGIICWAIARRKS